MTIVLIKNNVIRCNILFSFNCRHDFPGGEDTCDFAGGKDFAMSEDERIFSKG